MGLFDWFSKFTGFGFSSFGADLNFASSNDDDFIINPATGIPMTDGIGSFDYEGNPFGMDLSEPLVGTTGDMFDPFSNDTGFHSFDD